MEVPFIRVWTEEKEVKDKTSHKNKFLFYKNMSLKYTEMIKQKKHFRANVVVVI